MKSNEVSKLKLLMDERDKVQKSIDDEWKMLPAIERLKFLHGQRKELDDKIEKFVKDNR